MNGIINFVKSFNPLRLIGEPQCLGCGEPGRATICDICLEELEPVSDGGCSRCHYPTGGQTEFLEPSMGCPWCERLSYLPSKFICAFIYRHKGAELFRKIKFSGYWRGNDPLCHYALNLLEPVLFSDPKAVVVTIPESFKSRIERPIHPADAFALRVAKKIKCKSKILLKTASSEKEQVGLDYEFRKQNMKNGFVWDSRRSLAEASEWERVYLVDDVLTTGATLEAATKVLKSKGVRDVIWVTLFRTL